MEREREIGHLEAANGLPHLLEGQRREGLRVPVDQNMRLRLLFHYFADFGRRIGEIKKNEIGAKFPVFYGEEGGAPPPAL